MLDRLEIELASHGGTMNGRLPVTYGDFQKYGIDRQAIVPAIREVIALGVVEVTERGWPSEFDFRRHPNLFRITYCRSERCDRTHEWRRHQTLENALAVADLARKSKDEKAVAQAKARSLRKTIAGVEEPHNQV
ncbi:hypothetical protein [Tardiphaga sp. 813_E8_N1_3]|uniref:hypothetical protein n=1 Tax=Tardiphaga sp. 813_E8_N1_3 TaxID=3240760 RepID=UPI003F225E96